MLNVALRGMPRNADSDFLGVNRWEKQRFLQLIETTQQMQGFDQLGCFGLSFL